MTSRELTAEQLARLRTVVSRRMSYYLAAWQRAQAAGMPSDDPLAEGICTAWNGLAELSCRIERLQGRLQPKQPQRRAEPHGPRAPASAGPARALAPETEKP